MQSASRIECPRDTVASIEDLQAEINRLNEELTCGSEAFNSIIADNARMRAALESAEQLLSQYGHAELATAMRHANHGVSEYPIMPSAYR